MKVVKLFPVVLLLLLGTNAIAQETPEFEIQGGYSLAHFNPARNYVRTPHDLNGGGFGFVYNVTHWMGFKAELEKYGGTAWNIDFPEPIVTPYHITNTSSLATIPAGTYKASGGLATYLFGPQFKYYGHKIQPFAQTLFGGARSNLWSNLLTAGGISGVSTKNISGFSMSIGGGVDYNANRYISIRLGEFDYLMTRLNPPLLTAYGGIQNQNSFRFSCGVVFQLGSFKR